MATIDGVTALPSPPTDGVTAVEWGPASNSNDLLVSSWDASLRLYDGVQAQLKSKVELPSASLDCCFGASPATAYAAGLDHSLNGVDFETGATSAVGSHDGAVKCVGLGSASQVVSASWDRTLRTWDPRAATPAVACAPLPGKAFTMGIVGHRVVVGTSERHVLLFDLRKLSPGDTSPEQRRASSLKFQTRCIGTSPIPHAVHGACYVLGSIEGRVAVEFVEQDVEHHKFAFKCHRSKAEDGAEVVHPVNAVAFHPVHGTFATGGCDGVVSQWDAVNRKKVATIGDFDTSISALSFSHDGARLAIAASYTFEEGEKDHPPDAIFVRSMADHEVRPKLRK